MIVFVTLVDGIYKLVGTQDFSKNWKWYKEHEDEEISQFYLDLKQNSLNWFKKTMYSR